jgi:hypothetical protein
MLSLFNKPKKDLDSTQKTPEKGGKSLVNKKLFYSQSLNNKEEKKSKIRVIKPKKNKILSEKIKNTIPIQKKEKKQFLFGFKNFEKTAKNVTNIKLDRNNLWKNLNLILVRYGVREKFNTFFATGLAISIIVFIFYLSFFDTYFLVDNYKILFKNETDSQGQEKTNYLSEKEILEITKAYKEKRSLSFFPNNQFWFANDFGLTAAAQQKVDSVESVSVIQRQWPDSLTLEIETDPILITLGIFEKNQKKYWRISQSGKVITQDESNILENLVFVETPITLSGSVNGNRNLTLQDFKLENSRTQLNRFWFIVWLWGQLESYDIEVVDTRLPSLLDTDVIITTREGTKMYFDSNVDSVPREALRSRIEQLFRSKVRLDLNDRKIAYLDFRLQSKRVVACYTNASCTD